MLSTTIKTWVDEVLDTTNSFIQTDGLCTDATKQATKLPFENHVHLNLLAQNHLAGLMLAGNKLSVATGDFQ